MIPPKELMSVVERIMGKPYEYTPKIYRWSAKNLFKVLYGEGRSMAKIYDLKPEQTVDFAIELTQQSLEDKTPFSLERNNITMLTTHEVPWHVQALYNLHELTHAYSNQHWPGMLAHADVAQSMSPDPYLVEALFVEKTLDEGLSEYVSLRTRNPAAREREKIMKEILTQELITPLEITEIIEDGIRRGDDVLEEHEEGYYLLGYGLIETIMRDSPLSTWDAFDVLVKNRPSLRTIGKMIDPRVYEVKG